MLELVEINSQTEQFQESATPSDDVVHTVGATTGKVTGVQTIDCAAQSISAGIASSTVGVS
ncbi:hypothetical protein M2272_002849 [Mycobacterium frederiksbergense]|uniref:BIG2 domain-containing protein n=1 Tax=Mycolicibacterium frederiksbergense TaxID=117567 RepID=A0ABT6KZT7_9MYCO|nr:hypothetical protein [Mycolicibacterium frederiksbergense]MDH6196206.1 hypothetical protein [Mycolicibacterium frederiksbergense]